VGGSSAHSHWREDASKPQDDQQLRRADTDGPNEHAAAADHTSTLLTVWRFAIAKRAMFAVATLVG
jgi:hypothetical protein